MERKPQALKRERFGLNTPPSIAKLLRAAAKKDGISISNYLESSLIESLAKGRSYDEMGVLQMMNGR